MTLQEERDFLIANKVKESYVDMLLNKTLVYLTIDYEGKSIEFPIFIDPNGFIEGYLPKINSEDKNMSIIGKVIDDRYITFYIITKFGFTNYIGYETESGLVLFDKLTKAFVKAEITPFEGTAENRFYAQKRVEKTVRCMQAYDIMSIYLQIHEYEQLQNERHAISLLTEPIIQCPPCILQLK